MRFERILVLEDDQLLLRTIVRTARRWSGHVAGSATIKDALTHVTAGLGLVLADVCLPDGQAHTVFRAARELLPTPLLIAFSGQATPEQAFALAQIGAAAYLSKPFSMAQLEEALADGLSGHGQIMISSATESGGAAELFTGDLGINERKLLLYLSQRPGRWASVDQLAREVFDRDDPSRRNLVWQYVHQLRKKLVNPDLLQSERGRGYTLKPGPPPEEADL